MLTIVNLFSINVLVQRLLNYYPNYSTHRLYFGEVEAPYSGNRIAAGRALKAKYDTGSSRNSGYYLRPVSTLNISNIFVIYFFSYPLFRIFAYIQTYLLTRKLFDAVKID